MDVIYSVSLMGTGEDKLCWILAKNRGFEVSSFFFFFFLLINNGTVLIKNPGTPRVYMDNSTSNA